MPQLSCSRWAAVSRRTIKAPTAGCSRASRLHPARRLKTGAQWQHGRGDRVMVAPRILWKMLGWRARRLCFQAFGEELELADRVLQLVQGYGFRAILDGP